LIDYDGEFTILSGTPAGGAREVTRSGRVPEESGAPSRFAQ